MFPLNANAENTPNRENTFRNLDMLQSKNDDGNANANANGNAYEHRYVNNQMDISDSDACRAKADLSNLKVTVGIDEDLQMILEMDPSIVDLVRSYCAFFRISEPNSQHFLIKKNEKKTK